MVALKKPERKLLAAPDHVPSGFEWIAGVDEAGRGPLAGPVVACACLIPPHIELKGVRDSKMLPAAVRERLYWEIISQTIVGIGVVGEGIIDEINILQASLLAMKYAVLALPRTPMFLFVDGLHEIDLPLPQKAVCHGDDLIQAIGAASIVAKVTRDAIMDDLHSQYPQYGFHQHKGYATPEHLACLDLQGPSPVHRMSFAPVQIAAGKQEPVG